MDEPLPNLARGCSYPIAPATLVTVLPLGMLVCTSGSLSPSAFVMCSAFSDSAAL